MTQEIIVGQIAEYTPFRQQLAELKANNEALVFEYETVEGEKEARSHINTIRLSKGAVERTKKELSADLLVRTRLINDEAKQIIAALDDAIEVHMKPLEEKAEREAMSEQDYMYGTRELQAIINQIRDGKCTDEQRKEFNELFMAGLEVSKGE
jgi:hypothetical protein